jgi:hypothetical protein
MFAAALAHIYMYWKPSSLGVAVGDLGFRVHILARKITPFQTEHWGNPIRVPDNWTAVNDDQPADVNNQPMSTTSRLRGIGRGKPQCITSTRRKFITRAWLHCETGNLILGFKGT